jgi:hypothetical protein
MAPAGRRADAGRRTLSGRHLIASALLALMLPGLAGLAAAQRAEAVLTRERAISVFLLNALYYGQWPGDADWQRGRVARICVLGPDTLGASLQNVADDFQAKRFRDGRVIVKRSEDPATLTDCHVLFVGSAGRELAALALEALGSLPVILVGEERGFADRGGTFEIRAQAGAQPSWDLNLDRLAATGVEVASQMKIRSDAFVQGGRRTPNRLR